MSYQPDEQRYSQMTYNRCGRIGIKLPAISLGLWNNFGDNDAFDNCRNMIHRAFDLGITHFDLANNYGPKPGAAESKFGKILSEGLGAYRDELLISTKAGYLMWPGPYGEWGSRKYLLSSLDQSLKRMELEYVDIFYSHRPDPDTPLEETMGALDTAVRQGKALYAGISSYPPDKTRQAAKILRELGTPCLIHQPSYSMLNRWVEDGLLDTLEDEGIGAIAFCPLAQGLLTSRYLNGIPDDSRAGRNIVFLRRENITEEVITKVHALNVIARRRNQSLAQMALAWILKDHRITSVLIGASKVSQIEENIQTLKNLVFPQDELTQIESILQNKPERK
ncbi:MAG: L-glyceraldehyde 3-phosphate reductase [Victivallaceae bacterium]